MYEALIGPRTSVSDYAWIITKDHLFEEYGAIGQETSDVGVIGPGTAHPDLIAQLESGKGHVFRMYDDDGELYYTGKLVTIDGSMEYVPVTYANGLEDYVDPCEGPLRDFGRPNAGCTLIKWHGRPEWDCEG